MTPSRPRRGIAAAALVVSAAALAGCAATDPGAQAGAGRPLTSDGSSPGPESGLIEWEGCGDSLECGTLSVPLDHDDPSAGTIALPLTRHLAMNPDGRIGSLLVNPGGPGVGALFLAEAAEQIYQAPLLDHFDIVAWDPRGVGGSEPHVDCVDGLDDYFALDPTPDDTAERDALVDSSQAFADACAQRTGTELLSNISTRDAAMDMDLIRRALGEATISYFGFSYGSELGAMWATLFPDTVRAAVFDSASAPNAEGDEQAVEDTVALERVFIDFLDDCAGDESCAFYNDGAPAAAFSDLMDALERAPLDVGDDRPPVNEAVALFAVVSALYDDRSWPALAQQLADAQGGDGKGLLDAYDDYLLRNPDGTYTNEFEALLAVNCIDNPGPITREGVDALNAKIAVAAPLLGRFESMPYVCADWPVRQDSVVPITGAGAGPVLVMGATGDPVTSIESSRKMADALEGGVLVTVDVAQHTVYGANDCGDDAVNSYLVDLTVPEDGTFCE